jgi:hypothetical protein
MTDGDRELMAEEVRVERKRFLFSLQENEQGRFLRITECVGSRRGSIVVPDSGLDAVAAFVRRASELLARLPPKPPAPAGPENAHDS